MFDRTILNFAFDYSMLMDTGDCINYLNSIKDKTECFIRGEFKVRDQICFCII